MEKSRWGSTTWNYRVVKVETEYGPEWALYEVYYDDDDKPVARTEDPATFTSDTDPDDVRDSMVRALSDAMKRPVLDDAEIGEKR